MADGTIIIDTKVDSGSAEKDINNLSGKLSSLANKGLKVFTGAVIAAGGAIGGLAGIATKYNSQMEDYFANFTVLLGSATAATKHVEDLKDFAAKTPFEMAGLADASKQLLSFGIDVEDIMPDLQMLGDISLGNQERFKGLALVFAQVASAGKLSGQDLLQFINQGFNPLQVIAEKTGKSMSDLKEEMSDGKITYEMVAEAMKVATSEGGKFFQGMEVASQTLNGQWSTLKDDTMSLIGDAFMPFSDILKNSVMPALQGMVEQMSDAFSNPDIQNSISNIATGLGDFAVKIGDLISNWLPKLIEGFSWVLDHSSEIMAGIVGIGTALAVLNVVNMIMGVVKAFQAFKLANEGATIAQWLLNAAMAANPIGIIIGLVVGLIAAFIYLWNTNEEFREAIINCWNAILDAGKVVWDWLVKFFTEDIPSAFNTIKEWFAGLPEWFSELWSKVTAKFSEWGENISNFFTETIPKWIENIGAWFNELPYLIGYALGYVLAKIIEWGINTWIYFAENIPIWIENISNWFSELPGKIQQWLTDTFNKTIEWGSNMAQKAKESAQEFINKCIEWFSKLPGRVNEWFTQTITKANEFATNLGDKAKEAGKEMVDKLTNAVKNLPSQMMSVGKNIVEGVWNGITSMGSWLSSKVSGFFNGIVDGAKKALGIHSPSRVFRDEVGKYMAQGVGVGFDDESESVEKDMQSSIESITAKMKATVVVEQSGSIPSGVSKENNSIVNNGQTDNRNRTGQPTTLEIPVIVDGREVARATAPYTDEFEKYQEGR